MQSRFPAIAFPCLTVPVDRLRMSRVQLSLLLPCGVLYRYTSENHKDFSDAIHPMLCRTLTRESAPSRIVAMSSSHNTQSFAEPRARGVFTASVLSNDPLCPEHYLLCLGMENFPPTHPGQFINILCGKAVGRADRPTFISANEKGGPPAQPTDLSQPETAGRVPLLRRPFSLAGRRDMPAGTVELDILYRVVGAGSNWISEREIGDEVNILGPLGNGFETHNSKPLAVVIGGGTGIGPMIYLAESLSSADKDVKAFVGARSASALPLTEEQKGFFEITTDDGSLGQAGMVHEAFAQWLERGRTAEMAVYACGPEPMMKAVADICAPSGIECQLAMERHMACGMGVCQGCAIKVKTDEPPGWMFKLACKDGPVFNAGELLWE